MVATLCCAVGDYPGGLLLCFKLYQCFYIPEEQLRQQLAFSDPLFLAYTFDRQRALNCISVGVWLVLEHLMGCSLSLIPYKQQPTISALPFYDFVFCQGLCQSFLDAVKAIALAFLLTGEVVALPGPAPPPTLLTGCPSLIPAACLAAARPAARRPAAAGPLLSITGRSRLDARGTQEEVVCRQAVP